MSGILRAADDGLSGNEKRVSLWQANHPLAVREILADWLLLSPLQGKDQQIMYDGGMKLTPSVSGDLRR